MVDSCQRFLKILQKSVRILQSHQSVLHHPSLYCIIDGKDSCMDLEGQENKVKKAERTQSRAELAVLPRSPPKGDEACSASTPPKLPQPTLGQSPVLPAASSAENSLARMPPILLKAGNWRPYLASSEAMLLSSSAAMVQRCSTLGPESPNPCLVWTIGRSWLTCEFYFPIQVMDLRGQP